MKEISAVHPLIWAALAVILLLQGSWIFYDASKRGENKWFWGLFGLLNVPSSLIIYLIITRLILKSKPCSFCGRRIGIKAKYCPHCGREVVDK